MPAIAELPEMAPSPAAAASTPMSAPPVLRKQSFLRNSLDQAIASLTADGTIAGILDGRELPGDAVNALTPGPGECASIAEFARRRPHYDHV